MTISMGEKSVSVFLLANGLIGGHLLTGHYIYLYIRSGSRKMLSLENMRTSQYVVVLHHTNGLQKSLGDYHTSTRRNLNFRERSQPSIESKLRKKYCQRPLRITSWRTSNGYFYRRTFSRTLLLHQEHNASIWLAKWRWLGEYRPIIMKYSMLISHGTNVWYQRLVTLPSMRWMMIHQTSHAFISVSPNLVWLENLIWYKDIIACYRLNVQYSILPRS